MFNSCCEMTIRQPKINEGQECIQGELATNGGGKVGHGLLFLPQFQCGVHVTCASFTASDDKISHMTQDTFKQMAKAFSCSETKTVNIPLDLAKVIAEEKGEFEGMKWYRAAYQSNTPLWYAMVAFHDRFFDVCFEK